MKKQKKITPTKKKVKAAEKKWYVVASLDWVYMEDGSDAYICQATSPKAALAKYAGDDLDFDGSIVVAELTNTQVYENKISRKLVVNPNKQLGDVDDKNE